MEGKDMKKGRKRRQAALLAAVFLGMAAVSGCRRAAEEVWYGEEWLESFRPEDGWLEKLWEMLWPEPEREEAVSEEAVRADLETTLKAMTSPGGGETAYLWGEEVSGAAQGESEDTALSQVRSRTEFEIISVEADQAELRIISPDVMKMMETCIASGEVSDGSQIPEMIKEAMTGEFPAKEYIVQVELRELDGHSYLVPNSELENALSGGVYEAYSRMISEYVKEAEEK